jgi:hypothetical protein
MILNKNLRAVHEGFFMHSVMSKPWVGYLASVFLLLAGVLQIFGDQLALGIFLIGMSIVGLIIKFYMNKRAKGDTD